MRSFISILTILVIAVSSASGQQIYKSATGDEFLNACRHGDKACAWLVLGITESLNALKFASGAAKLPAPFDVCIPDGTNADQIVDKVTVAMTQVKQVNPQLYEAPASPLISSTLASVYPCKG